MNSRRYCCARPAFQEVCAQVLEISWSPKNMFFGLNIHAWLLKWSPRGKIKYHKTLGPWEFTFLVRITLFQLGPRHRGGGVGGLPSQTSHSTITKTGGATERGDDRGQTHGGSARPSPSSPTSKTPQNNNTMIQHRARKGLTGKKTAAGR